MGKGVGVGSEWGRREGPVAARLNEAGDSTTHSVRADHVVLISKHIHAQQRACGRRAPKKTSGRGLCLFCRLRHCGALPGLAGAEELRARGAQVAGPPPGATWPFSPPTSRPIMLRWRGALASILGAAGVAFPVLAQASSPDTPPPPAAAAAASPLALAHAAAARLRGPSAAAHPAVDATGASALALTLRDGTALVLAPPVRALPADTGDIQADMEALVRSLQDEICGALLAVEAGAAAAAGGAEPVTFREDAWVRAEGGGGRSRVIQGGRVFEKAGVNVSTVCGALPPGAVAQMRSRPGRAAGALGTSASSSSSSSSSGGAAPSAPLPFFACGISLVLHPHNPMAPSVHANYRLFRVLVGGEWVWWFGGGADLSPSYVFPEDAAHFHAVHAAACHRAHPTAYARFKAWADAYFALPHRGTERRGVGGIFFDDLDTGSLGSVCAEGLGGAAGAPQGAREPYRLLPFVADAGRSFLHAYLPVLLARADAPYTPAQRDWQQVRRGRYVEFNLVHDRGTKFGLATPGARIESILMSLPLTARWEYGRVAEPSSAEAACEGVLKAPVEWLAPQPEAAGGRLA